MKKFIIFFIVLLSCNKEKKNKNDFQNLNNDTIYSKGNEIIFFKPSKEFYQKELIDFEGIEELESDFEFYSNQVLSDLSNNLQFPIKAKISESRFLGIIDFKKDTIYVDRYKDSLHYGTLLNFKEKKYIIEEGVFTDDDFFVNIDSEFNKIDFNSEPINSKVITLDEEKYWVTSSMRGNKKRDTICKYKDFWLKRTYNIIPKEKEEFSKNLIEVFVKDDVNKWNGEKAIEEFKSIRLKDNSITLWKNIKVGLTIDELITFIKEQEYHKDNGVVKLYSKEFESTFIIKNKRVYEIEVKRRCR